MGSEQKLYCSLINNCSDPKRPRPIPKPPKMDPAAIRFRDQRIKEFMNRMSPRDPSTLIENIDPRQENRRDLDDALQGLPDRRLDDEFMCRR